MNSLEVGDKIYRLFAQLREEWSPRLRTYHNTERAHVLPPTSIENSVDHVHGFYWLQESGRLLYLRGNISRSSEEFVEIKPAMLRVVHLESILKALPDLDTSRITLDRRYLFDVDFIGERLRTPYDAEIVKKAIAHFVAELDLTKVKQ